MFMGVEHGGFIFASYMFAGLVFSLLIIYLYVHVSRQKKRLQELEASGATRRRRRVPKSERI